MYIVVCTKDRCVIKASKNGRIVTSIAKNYVLAKANMTFLLERRDGC